MPGCLAVEWRWSGSGSYNLARPMDYDATAVPLGYDRGRTHGPEMLDLWMRTVERYLDCLPLTEPIDVFVFRR